MHSPPNPSLSVVVLSLPWCPGSEKPALHCLGHAGMHPMYVPSTACRYLSGGKQKRNGIESHVSHDRLLRFYRG
jgi:hypothetical protein